MHQPLITTTGSGATLLNTNRPNLLMSSTLCRHQLAIELELEEEKKMYTNLTHIRGNVHYSSEFEHSEHYLVINLMGIAHVNMDVWHQPSMAYKSIISQWAFLKVESTFGLHETDRQVEFDFEVPRTLQPYQCPLGHSDHLNLPPSVGPSDNPARKFDLSVYGDSVRIVYQIRAELKRTSDNSIVGHAVQPFSFVPQVVAHMHSPSNPIELKTQEKAVRTTLGRSIGSMLLAVDETCALNTSGTNQATTSPLPMTFTFHGTRPPILTRIDAALIARTLRRVTHRHENVKHESSSSVCKHLQTTTLDASPSWRQSNTELQKWYLNLLLPVTLGKSLNIAVMPSFESCLLARAYSLRLSISVSGGSTLGLRSVEFEVPITVEHRLSQSSRRSTLESKDSATEARPSYWDVTSARAEIAPVSCVPIYSVPVSPVEAQRRPSWLGKG